MVLLERVPPHDRPPDRTRLVATDGGISPVDATSDRAG